MSDIINNTIIVVHSRGSHCLTVHNNKAKYTALKKNKKLLFHVCKLVSHFPVKVQWIHELILV